MTDRVITLLKEAVDKLKTQYADETIKYDLDAEGDNKRRMAAAKHHALDDLHKALKAKLKENL